MKKIFHNFTDGKTKPQTVATIIFFIVFVLYSVFILFFFLFAFLIAVKENQSAFLDDQIAKRLFCWPSTFTFKNFAEVFPVWDRIIGVSYFEMTFNSVWISLLGPFINSFCTATVTYVLVFYRSKFTKRLYKLGVLLAILPIYGSGGASYKLLTDIGMIDTPFMLLTNITLFGANFFYFYAFYKSISWQFAEAAFMDGASHWQVYLKIMLPMLIPSATALYVMNVIATWNDYSSNLLYFSSFPILSYGAYAFGETAKYTSNEPSFFAGVLISIVPVLVLFGSFQNTIMEKVHIGGLKG